eukprot:g22290.t1
MFGGAPCEGPLKELDRCEVSECNLVDCAWGDWAGWSDCSCKCGGGTKRRTRNVVQAPRNGGQPCEPQARLAGTEVFTATKEFAGQRGSGTLQHRAMWTRFDCLGQAHVEKLPQGTATSLRFAVISRPASQIRIASCTSGESGLIAAAIALASVRGPRIHC